MLFTLAANSWRGAHVSAHGRSYVRTQRSSRFEETAPIMWLCWGTGTLNDATLPATALATARRYVLPDAVRAAARWAGSGSAASTTRGPTAPSTTCCPATYASDLAVYRTPHAMLSCAEDYRAGLPGLQELIWSAALGPETQVYVTHAPNAATHSSARPNAWAGNRILPRARQHHDTVLALYRIPGDDPMGYTHAWFPLSTMDEWVASGDWLAGRRGDGLRGTGDRGRRHVRGRGPDRAAGAARQRSRPGLGLRGGRRGPGRHVRRVHRGTGRAGVRRRRGRLPHPARRGPVARAGPARSPWTDSRLDVGGMHLDNPLARVPLGAERMDVDGHVIDLRTGRPRA